MKTKLILFLVALSLSAVAQQSNLELNFENTFNGKEISFGKEYANAHGEKLSFTLLNYFISNIRLTSADGSVYSCHQTNLTFWLNRVNLRLQNFP